jgi:hypothetical protein
MLPNETMMEGDSLLHCSTEWHLAQLKGKGARLTLYLYDLSCRVSVRTGRFSPSMQRMAAYLQCTPGELYCAAAMLVEEGFWIVLDSGIGKPTQYRPVRHKEWQESNPNRCTTKASMPWDEEQQDQLAPLLYGVTGGHTFYTNVLTGWRRRSGLTDEAIIERAKVFMSTPDHTKNGSAFRKALGEFLCSK